MTKVVVYKLSKAECMEYSSERVYIFKKKASYLSHEVITQAVIIRKLPLSFHAQFFPASATWYINNLFLSKAVVRHTSKQCIF